MARLSSIDRLPAELRVLIGRRRRAGAIIAEIREELAGLGYRLSIATVGKFTRTVDDHERASATARRAVEDLCEDVSSGLAGRLSAVNIELLQARVLDTLGQRLSAGQELEVAELRHLAEALKLLAAAAKTDAERERALLDRAADRAAKVVSARARPQTWSSASGPRSLGPTPEIAVKCLV